jgi:hypothetical protein
MTTDERRLRVLPVTAAVAIAAIAIGATVLAPGPATRSTASGSTTGAGFRLQLELGATSVPADGTPIQGYVLVINHTGKPVEVRDASCDAWVQAGLSGTQVAFVVSSLDVRCGSGQLREGRTRIAVKIATTYTGCQQGNRSGTAKLPHCIGRHDSEIPPLPPGDYRVEVGTQHVSAAPALPQPRRVTLTPAK